MSGFSDDLDRVLKYGVAPADELKAIAKGLHGQPEHNETLGDHILADKLADNSDPREMIVRRHLQRNVRPISEGSHPLYGWTIVKSLGASVGSDTDPSETEERPTGDGVVRLMPYTNRKTGKQVVRVVWEIHHTPNASKNANYDTRTYSALLTPQEADLLRQEFPNTQEPYSTYKKYGGR